MKKKIIKKTQLIGCIAAAMVVLGLVGAIILKKAGTADTIAVTTVSVDDIPRIQYGDSTGKKIAKYASTPGLPSGNASPQIHRFETVEEYAAVSAYGPLPGFLSDVGFDGGIELDDNGSLVVSHNMRLLFDFFLAAVRTEGMELCSARIKEYIELTLPHDTQQNAIAIWDSYKTYKLNMKELYRNYKETGYNTPEEYRSVIRDTLKKRNALRRQYMTEEVVQAFFSTEETYERDVLVKLDGKS